MDLFTLEELRAFLRYAPDDEFAPDSVQQAHDMAASWIADAADVDDVAELWDGSVPKRLKGWAIELAAIAYENPTSAGEDSAAESSTSWRVDRRAQILARVTQWAISTGRSSTSSAPLPTGSFPPAQPWPDAYPGRRW